MWINVSYLSMSCWTDCIRVKYDFGHQGSKKVQQLLVSRSHWFQNAQVALTEQLEAFYWTGDSLSAAGLTNLGLQFLQVLFNTVIKGTNTNFQAEEKNCTKVLNVSDLLYTPSIYFLYGTKITYGNIKRVISQGSRI